MSIADRGSRSARPVVVLVVLLLIVGAAGFLFMRGAGRVPDGAKPAAAEAAPASAVAQPAAAPDAPADVASHAVAALSAASGAARPATSWQASAQPAVVAAIRTDSLAQYQVQMEHWACEKEQCVADVRIPPTVEAGRKRDLSATADVFDKLKAQMDRADVNVSLRSVQPGADGIAMSFQFIPKAAMPGRFYTDAEIAQIRLDSVQQGVKMSQDEAKH